MAQNIHFNMPSMAQRFRTVLVGVNLPGLSPSLWLTFEKVKASQTNTYQQFPTIRTQTQEKCTAAQSSSITPLYYYYISLLTEVFKRRQYFSPQHTKSIPITWRSEHAQLTSLFFDLFKFVIPLQQCSLLCSNNSIPHKCRGFQPSNLATKDQRIASRLSQMRTIVSGTLYTINAPIKLCAMGMNVYLSLCELLLYKGKSLKST